MRNAVVSASLKHSPILNLHSGLVKRVWRNPVFSMIDAPSQNLSRLGFAFSLFWQAKISYSPTLSFFAQNWLLRAKNFFLVHPCLKTRMLLSCPQNFEMSTFWKAFALHSSWNWVDEWWNWKMFNHRIFTLTSLFLKAVSGRNGAIAQWRVRRENE